MNLLIFSSGDLAPVPRGKLALDLDAAADRLIVLDRDTAAPLYATKVFDNKSMELLLPAKYANSKTICVLMLDDSDVYAAVAEDRLQLELVNTSWNAT